MNLITDLKNQFTEEEFQNQVNSFKEIPMNQTLVVLKAKGAYADTPDDLINPIQRKQAEEKTYGQMKVVALSSDSDSTYQVGDLVRVRMFSPSPGTPVPCTIDKYELVFVKQFDVITVEKQ